MGPTEISPLTVVILLKQWFLGEAESLHKLTRITELMQLNTCVDISICYWNSLCSCRVRHRYHSVSLSYGQEVMSLAHSKQV